MTLKRIRTDQVELGMFIQRLEGNWFRHPFWKAQFVLDDPVRLETLRESGVRSLWIDIARGLDCHEIHADAASHGHLSGDPRARITTRGASPAGRRAASLSPEIVRAERLARATGKVVNRLFLEAQLGKHIAASDIAPVVDEIYVSIQRNIYAFNGLLQCQCYQVHLYRQALAISALMVALGRTMGLSPAMAREAGMVGLMMDVGFAQLSVEGGVTDYRDLPAEFAKHHVVHGLIQLRAAGDIPATVLTGCQHHHERLDGSGYPQGLAGTSIGMLGRMAAICVEYVGLVTGTHDGDMRDPANALCHMATLTAAYDAQIMQRLVEAVGVYPIGSFVRLRSGRLAMVVDQDGADNALPVVRIFGTIGENGAMAEGRQFTLALGHCHGEDAIAGIADPVSLALPSLNLLRHRLMAGAIRNSGR